MFINRKLRKVILLLWIALLSIHGCTKVENETISADISSKSLINIDAATTAGMTTSTTGFPMINLSILGDPNPMFAFGVNASGYVVGEAQPWDAKGAFIWSKQNGVKYLGTLGGEPTFSSAYDINDLGQVVGFSTEPEKISGRAFLWSTKDGMVNLGTTEEQDDPDNPFSMAFRINNQGEIVGETGNYAFLWTEKSGMTLLKTMQPYWKYSTAWDINDNGVMVGMCTVDYPEVYHAVLWKSINEIQDLGTIKTHSQALGINRLENVVGGSSDNCRLHERIGSYPNNYNGWYIFDHTCTAFIWTESNGLSQLPILEGGDASSANAINDRGQVVGWSYTTEGKVHAFVWTSKTGIKDLGTLPGDIESVAYSINNLGQVVGSSVKMDESGTSVIKHAVVWTLK
jgi:probable HAF family extracellular repeat protein